MLSAAILRPTLYSAAAPAVRPVQTAAAIGLLFGVAARIWMRTITEEPVFTVPGTLLILLVFAAMGAVVGWVYSRRKGAARERLRAIRAAALVPFLLMGPFMLLFIPSLGLAAVVARRHWRRLFRLPLLVLAGLVGIAAIIAFTSTGPQGPLAAALYALLSWGMFLAVRMAFEPVALPTV